MLLQSTQGLHLKTIVLLFSVTVDVGVHKFTIVEVRPHNFDMKKGRAGAALDALAVARATGGRDVEMRHVPRTPCPSRRRRQHHALSGKRHRGNGPEQTPCSA